MQFETNVDKIKNPSIQVQTQLAKLIKSIVLYIENRGMSCSSIFSSTYYCSKIFRQIETMCKPLIGTMNAPRRASRAETNIIGYSRRRRENSFYKIRNIPNSQYTLIREFSVYLIVMYYSLNLIFYLIVIITYTCNNHRSPIYLSKYIQHMSMLHSLCYRIIF